MNTLVAIAITVVGAAAAANAVRPAVEASAQIVARALFLADLARLDAFLLEVCSQVDYASAAVRASSEGVAIREESRGDLGAGSNAPSLRLSGTARGVVAASGGSRYASARIRVTEIRVTGGETPCLRVTATDPGRRDEEAWVLVAPFGRRTE